MKHQYHLSKNKNITYSLIFNYPNVKLCDFQHHLTYTLTEDSHNFHANFNKLFNHCTIHLN